MDLVPLDDDVISLELDRAFADCTLDGDASSLFYAASAIMRLQNKFGLIPRIQVGRHEAGLRGATKGWGDRGRCGRGGETV